jgi:nucleoside-diphosphate-sugar epimerase
VYAATPASTLPAKNEDTTVLVVGPTGYIGRYVTKELISRGYKARVRASTQRPARGRGACGA